MGDRLWNFGRQAVADSDEQLTERVRGGDHGAFGELYRRHRRAAESTARCLVRSRSDADDVVSEAFAGVLSAIRNGSGPRDNFRRYLLACVRNGCRVRQRVIPFAPEDGRFESGTGDPTRSLLEDPERYVEADTVARAFSSLTPRWQQMLWSTAVEQKTALEIGEQMALSPNAAAALAHRAREAFATAYLAEHVGRNTTEECDRYAPHLAGYVRGQLPAGRERGVEEHLRGCLTCSQAVTDLRDVNTSLRSLLPAPIAGLATLGPAAEVTLTGATVGGASVGVPFAGVLVKGLAGILLLAPLLVSDSSDFDGGNAREVREPVLQVQEASDRGVESTATDVSTTLPAVVPSDTELDTAPADSAPQVVVPDATVSGTAPSGAGGPGPGAGNGPAPTTTEVDAPEPTTGGVVTVPELTTIPVAMSPTSTLSAPTSTSPTTSTAPDGPVGLLTFLGLDKTLNLLGLTGLGEAVVAIDTVVATLTSEAVAPLVGGVLGLLPIEIDLSGLPTIPGIVLIPPNNPPPVTTGPPTTGGTIPGSTSPSGPTSPPGSPPSGTTTPGVAPSTPATASPTVPPATSSTPSAPGVTIPPVTVPPVTTPPVTIPPITIPPITIPPISVPVISVPPISIPPISIPLLPIPPITLPVIVLPVISLPVITLPPILGG